MTSGLIPKGPRSRAAVALISAMLGALSIYTFARIPQYNQIPDPRVIPINGLLWLALSITAVSISAYLVYTLDQQSEADNADPVDSEGRSSSTPIETLRQRYAAGDISHTEFERHLDQLLETEDLSQIDQPMPLLQNNEDTSHLDTESSSGLTEEESH